PRRGGGPVGQHAYGAGGVPVPAVPGVQRPGQLAAVVVDPADLAAPDDLTGVVDDEVGDLALGPAAAPAIDGRGVGLVAGGDLVEAEPVRDELVVAGDGDIDVGVAPGPEGDRVVGESGLVGHRATLASGNCRLACAV